MVTLKKAFKKYGVDNVKDLLLYPYMKYKKENSENLYYIFCLMALYLSVDSKILHDYSNFVEELEKDLMESLIKFQEQKGNKFSKEQLIFLNNKNLNYIKGVL